MRTTSRKTAPVSCMSLLLVLASTALFSPNRILAQSDNCVTVPRVLDGDSLLIELDPKEILVRVDKGEDEMTIEAVCLDVEASGYYRFVAGVEYSGGKSNESFYLEVFQPDSSLAHVCDANAGSVKVVNVVGDLPKADFDTTRDAGVYYLEAGTNHVILNHYALIADEYPEFINPESDGFDGPESVHFFQITLHYLSESTYDVKVEQSANVDTFSVDQTLTLSTKVTNLGPGMAREVSVQYRLPTFLFLADSTFSYSPEAIIKEDGEQVLHWFFDSLAADSELNLEFTGRIDTALAPTLPFEFSTRATVESVCDIDAGNNTDSLVFTILAPPPPPPVCDLTISQYVWTDSMVTEKGDTIWFAQAGETYTYDLLIQNLSPDSAQSIDLVNILPDSVSAPGYPGLDTLRWVLRGLAPLADTTVHLDVTVASDMPTGLQLLVNNIHVQAQNEAPEALLNNSASDTVYHFLRVLNVDVAISQTVRADTFVVFAGDTIPALRPGDEVIFDLFIQNRGDDPALEVTVIDSLPLFLESQDERSNIFVEQIPRLPAGSDTTLSFAALLSSQIPSQIKVLKNLALVSGANETDIEFHNNRSLASMFILHDLPEPELTDVAITQSVSADSFAVSAGDTTWYAWAGATVHYKLNVRNLELIPAESLLVKDILPDSVQTGGLVGDDTLAWQIPELAPLADTTLTVEMLVSDHIKQPNFQLINRATVQANNENPDKLENNFSVQSSPLFIIPLPDSTDIKPPDTTKTPVYQEGCDYFTLDYNVYRPDTGLPLGIQFEIAEAQHLRFDVYDMSGYHILNLAEEDFLPGPNLLNWSGTGANGQPAGSGVYIIVLRGPRLSCWKKVILAR